MKRTPLTVLTALTSALVLSTACQAERPVGPTPLPTLAAPPYVCGYLPQKAVELMTGIQNPMARGQFDLTIADGLGSGTCVIRQPDGDQSNVLVVRLSPGGSPGLVREQLDSGASPLPEIVPGAVGYYFKDRKTTRNAAYALLVRGDAEIGIALDIGAEGRDNAADVAALMKLIAPKLITDASAPSPSPSPTPSASKGD
jgi:hypothetical protein